MSSGLVTTYRFQICLFLPFWCWQCIYLGMYLWTSTVLFSNSGYFTKLHIDVLGCWWLAKLDAINRGSKSTFPAACSCWCLHTLTFSFILHTMLSLSDAIIYIFIVPHWFLIWNSSAELFKSFCIEQPCQVSVCLGNNSTTERWINSMSEGCERVEIYSSCAKDSKRTLS